MLLASLSQEFREGKVHDLRQQLTEGKYNIDKQLLNVAFDKLLEDLITEGKKTDVQISLAV